MKYVVIGAGPAGITTGFLLAKKKQKVTVLEQDSQVGGIARTIRYKKFRFDIGGHRFFAKHPKINRFWRKMLGKELMSVSRKSRIFSQGKFFSYPLEPLDALGCLGFQQSILALGSYLMSKAKPIKSPKTLEDVYINSFGKHLYKRFFEGYSQRLWGISPKKMEPDWGFQRVGRLSLPGAIKDAFLPHSSKVKSLIKKFYYPRLGPGQMWETVSQKFEQIGSQLFLKTKVIKIFHQKGRITGLETTNPKLKRLETDQLVSSMPIKNLINSLVPKPEKEILKAADSLKYRDLILVALVIDKKDIFPDQWIYIQDPEYTCLRIQNVNNWSQAMVGDKNKTVLGVEYVTDEEKPLWRMTDQELTELAKKEAAKLGFADPGQIVDAKVIRQAKAYPVYDLGYHQPLETIKNYLTQFPNLTLIGRNGMHKYNNMDHSMLMAIQAVENFFGKKHNLWQVNAEAEYLEKLKK